MISSYTAEFSEEINNGKRAIHNTKKYKTLQGAIDASNGFIRDCKLPLNIQKERFSLIMYNDKLLCKIAHS